MSLKSRAGGGWNKKSNLFPVRNPEQTKTKFYGSGVCLSVCVCVRGFTTFVIYIPAAISTEPIISGSPPSAQSLSHIFFKPAEFLFLFWRDFSNIFWFVRPGNGWWLDGCNKPPIDVANGECQKLTENIFWCFSIFFVLFLDRVSKSITSWEGRPGVLME